MVRERGQKHWHTRTCTCDKKFNRKENLFSEHIITPLSVSPTLNPPPHDKIINHIRVLSLRMIRTWVNPDLMSPDLFSFFLLLIDVS